MGERLEMEPYAVMKLYHQWIFRQMHILVCDLTDAAANPNAAHQG